MSKNNKRKSHKYIYTFIIGLIIFLAIIASVGYYYREISNKSYFYDKSVGLTELSIKKVSMFSLFQQAVTFETTTGNVGESISLLDQVITPQTLQLCGFNIQLYNAQSNNILNLSEIYTTPKDSNNYVYAATFTPNSAGNWTAVTRYLVTNTDCAAAAYDVSEGSYNSVFISTPICDKVAKCDAWIQDSTISHGYIDGRICYSVSSSCVYEVSNTEYRTNCDGGYKIVGTTDNTFGSGKLTCELMNTNSTQDCTTNSSICFNTQVCDTTLKSCVNKECNVDQNVSCSNGTVIITKQCINGRYTNTTNNCGNSTSTNNSSNNQTTSITCYRIITSNNTDSCQSISVAGNVCGDSQYVSQTLCEDKLQQTTPFNVVLIIIISVFGVAILGLIIFVIIRLRK